MQYLEQASGCQATAQSDQVLFVGNIFWLDQYLIQLICRLHDFYLSVIDGATWKCHYRKF